jgi:hypothetical protein
VEDNKQKALASVGAVGTPPAGTPPAGTPPPGMAYPGGTPGGPPAVGPPAPPAPPAPHNQGTRLKALDSLAEDHEKGRHKRHRGAHQ